jgi:hypothetical protein
MTTTTVFLSSSKSLLACSNNKNGMVRFSRHSCRDYRLYLNHKIDKKLNYKPGGILAGEYVDPKTDKPPAHNYML